MTIKKNAVEWYEELKDKVDREPLEEAYCDLFVLAKDVGVRLDASLKAQALMRLGYTQFADAVRQFLLKPSDGAARLIAATVKAVAVYFEDPAKQQ